MNAARKAELKPRVLELKQSGMTYSEVGRTLGIPKYTASYIAAYLPGERRALLENANYKCQKCGAKEGGNGIGLSLHHVNYLTGEGIVLCISCHVGGHGEGKAKGRRQLMVSREFHAQFSQATSDAGFSILRGRAGGRARFLSHLLEVYDLVGQRDWRELKKMVSNTRPAAPRQEAA